MSFRYLNLHIIVHLLNLAFAFIALAACSSAPPPVITIPLGDGRITQKCALLAAENPKGYPLRPHGWCRP